MAAGTASLCCPFVSADYKTIAAESGQNVTLTGRAPNSNITAVEWSRVDLKSEYVLYYRDEQLDPENQHPSFVNRVGLRDRQMKDGDVSLILKHVTIDDTGSYECRVFMEETGSWRLIRIINLSVVPPGPPGGHTEDEGKEDGGKEYGGKEDGGKEDEEEQDGSDGLIVCQSVSAVLLVVAVVVVSVVVLIYRKQKHKLLLRSCRRPPGYESISQQSSDQLI